MARRVDPATNDAPVALGTAIIALIEPHAGHEADFDRWYERDHILSCGACAPHTFAVVRYRGADEPRLRLALYWIEAGHHDEQSAWVSAQLPGLAEAGRMFPHRDHISTSAHDFLGAAVADPPGVPPELALDRRYRWVVTAWLDCAGGLDRVVPSVLDRLDALVDATPVEQALVFTPRANPDSWPDSIPQPQGLGTRVTVVCFADSPVADLALDAPEGATRTWMAPFELIRPGTG